MGITRRTAGGVYLARKRRELEDPPPKPQRDPVLEAAYREAIRQKLEARRVRPRELARERRAAAKAKREARLARRRAARTKKVSKVKKRVRRSPQRRGKKR
jgi:hypothetical protein